jgi:hypothetical protein
VVTAKGATARLRFESLSPTFCGPTLDDVSVTAVDASMPTLRERLLKPTGTTPAPGGGGRATSTAAEPSSAGGTAIAPTGSAASLRIQFCPVLTVFGPVGAEYRIESAEDLQSAQWTEVTNIMLLESPQVWVDFGVTNGPQRFYRAVPTVP